jgi:hypothetical protein
MSDDLKLHAVTLDDDAVSTILSALEDGVSWLNDRMEAFDDYTDEDIDRINERIREYQELEQDIKVLTGRAFRFDDHFEVIRDKTGDPLQPHMAGKPENHVWTVLDCDGVLCISPGRHVVNRLNYVVTTEPWSAEDETKDWVY